MKIHSRLYFSVSGSLYAKRAENNIANGGPNTNKYQKRSRNLFVLMARP